MEETEASVAADAGSTEKQEDKVSHPMEKMAPDHPEDGIMITTVGRVDLIPSIPVTHANISKTQSITRRKRQQQIR
jgi:hypothetical protein